MTDAPDLYESIAARVRTACAASWTVRAATSAEEAETEVLSERPTVLIVPAGERWSPPGSAGMRVTTGGVIAFSAVVALVFPGGHAEWSAARDAIRAALLGWAPDHPETAAPIHASGARLLAYSADAGGRWIHAFDFTLPARAIWNHQS